jgi:zinc protease
VSGSASGSASASFKPEHRAKAASGKHERVSDAIPTETLFVAFHGEGFLNEHNVNTAEILCSILSDGMSSRLYKHLAYEKQIASEINAYVDDRQFASLFNIYAIANGENISCDALRTAVQEVLDGVVASGVSDYEVTKAQNRISTRLARTLQRTSGIADEAAHQSLFFGDPTRVFSLLDGFKAVTAADVHALARQLFTSENEVRVDFSPRAAAA